MVKFLFTKILNDPLLFNSDKSMIDYLSSFVFKVDQHFQIRKRMRKDKILSTSRIMLIKLQAKNEPPTYHF